MRSLSARVTVLLRVYHLACWKSPGVICHQDSALSLCSCCDLGRYILTCLYFHLVLGAQQVSLQLLSMILSSTHSGCFGHAVPWPPFSLLLVQPPVLVDACCIFSTWFSLVFGSSTEEEKLVCPSRSALLPWPTPMNHLCVVYSSKPVATWHPIVFSLLGFGGYMSMNKKNTWYFLMSIVD